MHKIIVGLGNPGQKYKGTRHNIGFEAIDKLCYDHNLKPKHMPKFKALVAEGTIAGKKVALVQPLTYMNLSGESVEKIMYYYKLTPADVVVIYDDVALPVGAIRIRQTGSAAGQKGMINIIARLKTQDFDRIRIGVGDKPPQMNLADYVLSRFFKEEWQDMIAGVTYATDAIEAILAEDTIAAMNKFNRKK